MWLMALGGLVLTVGGATMLGFGILNAVKTTKYNNEIMSRTEVYCTNCIYCSRPITCALKDFKAHKNYPEGFVYCPFCNRPVSKNTFNIISP